MLQCELFRRIVHYVIRSPVLRMQSDVLRMFLLFHLSTHFLRRPTFSKLLHMTWLQPQRKRCYADLTKIRGEKASGLKQCSLSVGYRNATCQIL